MWNYFFFFLLFLRTRIKINILKGTKFKKNTQEESHIILSLWFHNNKLISPSFFSGFTFFFSSSPIFSSSPPPTRSQPRPPSAAPHHCDTDPAPSRGAAPPLPLFSAPEKNPTRHLSLLFRPNRLPKGGTNPTIVLPLVFGANPPKQFGFPPPPVAVTSAVLPRFPANCSPF